MQLTPPKAILFDWDNTLVDTWPVIHEALVYCFTKMEREPWSFEETKARVAHSMRDYFPKLFGDRWEEAGQHYIDGYAKVPKDKLKPLFGAEKTLQLIEEAGLYQAVVSNKRGPNLRNEAEYLDWAKYFKALVGAGDASNDKPHPAHALMALEEYTHPHGMDIWFIGDSSADIEIAKNAGFTAIFYGPESKAETITYPIHARVENHDELMELLSSQA